MNNEQVSVGKTTVKHLLYYGQCTHVLIILRIQKS